MRNKFISLHNYKNNTVAKAMFHNHRLSVVIGERNDPFCGSVGFTPGVMCVTGICYTDCPARYLITQYKGIKRAWGENTEFIKEEPTQFFDLVSSILKDSKIKFFQINTSGDMVNQSLLDGWVWVANRNNQIKFMTFTKNFTLDFSNRPNNFNIMLSDYPGRPAPSSGLPIAKIIEPYGEGCQYTKCLFKNQPCHKCWFLQPLDVIRMPFIRWGDYVQTS